MRRTFTLGMSLGCCLLLGSAANGQGVFEQFGRQLGNELQGQARQAIQGRGQNRSGGQRGGGNQGGGSPKTYGAGQLPSEGGSKSGPGPGNRYIDQGGGFLLPGNPNPGGRPFTDRPYQGQPYQGQPHQSGQGQPYQGQPYSGSIQSGSDMPTRPVRTADYIIIRCPQSAAGSIRYTLSSNRGNYGFTMSGGQEQRFGKSAGWTISYNDGTQQRRYKLVGGKAYTLKRIEGNRWQLYSVAAPGS